MAVWANVEPVARTMARAPNRRAATFIVLSPLSKFSFLTGNRMGTAYYRSIIARRQVQSPTWGNSDSRILCQLFLGTSVFERVRIRTLHECNNDLELEMKRVRVCFDERGHFRAFEQCDTSFVRTVSPV